MTETISSGLTLVIPVLGEVGWATTIRNSCFVKISEHDHTGSGKGIQIATGAIATSAVTLAKIADIATDRLLGRDTAGTGVLEALTVGGGIEFTGSGGIQRSALTGDVTAAAGSGATTIANNAVTTVKILNDNITTAKILDANVTTAKIADGNVTEAKLADDAATRSTMICFEVTSTSDGNDASPVEAKSLLRVTTPKAFKATHLSLNVHIDNPVASGTLAVYLYKNGATTAQFVTITGSGTSGYATITTQSYAAGDTISIALQRGTVTFTGGSASFKGTVWGHFTE